MSVSIVTAEATPPGSPDPAYEEFVNEAGTGPVPEEVLIEEPTPAPLGTAGLPSLPPPLPPRANVQVVPEPLVLPVEAQAEAATEAAPPASQLPAVAQTRELSTTTIGELGLRSEDPLVLRQWGEVVVESRMFPNIDTWQAAVATGKMCMDLRLAPWISMGQFHIIEGKPVLSLPLILQLVKRAKVKYFFNEDYGYYNNPASNAPDFLTEITFYHESLPNGTVSYRKWFSECILAGWTKKLNWQNMPRTMLRARVITESCRLYFPDLLGGSYEFSEMVDAGKFEDHTYAMEV